MNVIYNPDIRKFLHSLSEPAQSHAYKTIDLLKQYGHMLGLPQSKALGGGLYELRVRGKQEIRMFYVFHQSSAVILHIFIKKTQKTPAREINIAHKRKNMLTKI